MGRPDDSACRDDIAHLELYREPRLTRLSAELSRDALAADLILNISTELNGKIPSRDVTIDNTIGAAPPCPSNPPCPPTSVGGSEVNNDGDSNSGCACATQSSAGASPAGFGALITLGWVIALRRRKALRSALP
jgi:MYXO-CTERM domain-containing protein